MTLSPAFLDEVRDRTSLSALVGRSVKLTKAGREMKGCCPFHQEKTPSFYVNDDKAFYHCFGCGAHGDAIRFLTDAKGLPFIDAVKELADAAGLEMPAPDPRDRAREERASGLHDIVGRAADWFRSELAGLSGGEARAYLDGRGVKPETRTAFGLGFAPDARGKLRVALKADGDDKLLEAGLLVKPDDGRDPYDRFRGRLIIPIRDARGRTIAFGGRVIGDGEPKYLNSPETPLFDKGRTLFNLDKAGPASRKAGRLVVVEGYLDVIALHQAGIEEAVAPLGTALTEAQLERLWRLTETPILCFDGDAAGQAAILRAILRAVPILKPQRSLLVAQLPENLDPDDTLRSKGPEFFREIISDAIPLDLSLYHSLAKEVDKKSFSARSSLKQSLEDVSLTCQDKTVSYELRRNLLGYFFENFGWKQTQRQAIGNGIINTGPFRAPDLMRMYLRSVLYGLSRFPAVARQRIDEISGLDIEVPELRQWRDDLVVAIVNNPSVDDDIVYEILYRSDINLNAVRRFELRTDRLFSFTVEPADNERAQNQLIGLVEILAHEGRLNAEMERLTRQAMEDTAGDNYMAIEAARQRVREGRSERFEAAYYIGKPGDPADATF